MVTISHHKIKQLLTKPKKNLLLIHGAWSTNTAFNYLIEKLKGCHALANVYYCDYNTDVHDISRIIDKGNRTLDEIGNDTIVVGHSMGGIAAIGLHDHSNVSSIVTIASPLHGLQMNRLVQMTLAYISPNVLDIMNDSKLMNELQNKDFTKPITCIVTTRGFHAGWPLMEKTDGVVTIASQKKWIPNSAQIHEVPYSHHEVLQSEALVEIVKDKLEK